MVWSYSPINLLTQTLFSGFFLFLGMLKCNEIQMAVIGSKISKFRRFL